MAAVPDDGKGAKKAPPAKGGKDAAPPPPPEVITSIFVPYIEEAVQEYVAKWQDRDEGGNTAQRYDPELVKEELRPIVFEEVRVAVDEEMRVLLTNLKDMVDAERAAKAGKKLKKKKPKKPKKKKDKKGGKKKKDPTADRSMESLFAELVSNGILQKVPPGAHLHDYLGACGYVASTLERGGAVPDPSMAQVRHALAEYAVLPLGSQLLHEKLPHVKTLLLYGPPSSGKTLLTRAVASLAGANFFNLSPRNTDGKYPGKNCPCSYTWCSRSRARWRRRSCTSTRRRRCS